MDSDFIFSTRHVANQNRFLIQTIRYLNDSQIQINYRYKTCIDASMQILCVLVRARVKIKQRTHAEAEAGSSSNCPPECQPGGHGVVVKECTDGHGVRCTSVGTHPESHAQSDTGPLALPHDTSGAPCKAQVSTHSSCAEDCRSSLGRENLQIRR